MLNFALLTKRVSVTSTGIEAAAFLARVSGASLTLDTTHTNMYTALINGLVADGIWSKLDVLYFFATNTVTGLNTTLACLNLKSSSFNGTIAGPPTFTADQGFATTDNASNHEINSNFNPSTAGGNYTQNAAHVSVWANNAVTAVTGGVAIGCSAAGGAQTDIYPRYNDGKMYFRVNDTGAGSAGIINASSIGHYVSNRSAASGTTSSQGYKNAVDQGVVAVASNVLTNMAMGVLASGSSGSFGQASACQLSCATIGGNLTPTDVTNLYNRLATARTTVGL